jgi:tRNA pseudouridine55 synthase
MNQIHPTRINRDGTMTGSDVDPGFPVFSAVNLPENRYDFANGSVWLVNKPKGWTSFRVVGLLRKLTGVRKVGHAGTLDPLATGLLILCTGRATKAITRLIGEDKRYICDIQLGGSTPSYDSETEIHASAPFNHINQQQIEEVLVQHFTGPVKQIPPMYSALKHKGTPLYKFARRGEDIPRACREVTIYSIQLLGFTYDTVRLDIHCSKGTYIRTLANDLGKQLGTLAHLKALERTAISVYRSDSALNIKTIIELLDPDGNYTIPV